MRIATIRERTEALAAAGVNRSWLLPVGATPKAYAKSIVDPGYVYAFETRPWKDCFLVMSDPDNAGLFRQGLRVKHEPTQPARSYRGVFRQNICLIKKRRCIFTKKKCHLVEPLLDIPEGDVFHLIETTAKGAQFFRVTPSSLKTLGCLDLSNAMWDCSPSVRVFYGGEKASIMLAFSFKSNRSHTQLNSEKRVEVAGAAKEFFKVNK